MYKFLHDVCPNNFQAIDRYDDDAGSSRIHVAAAAAFGGTVVVAAWASLRYYKNAVALSTKRRCSGTDEELSRSFRMNHRNAEMTTPTTLEHAGSPIAPNCSLSPPVKWHQQNGRIGQNPAVQGYRLPPYPQPSDLVRTSETSTGQKSLF